MVYKGVCIHNVVELVEKRDGVVPLRIPDSLRRAVNAGVRLMASQGAGVEMRFNLKSKGAKLVLKSKERGCFLGEIFQGNFLAESFFVSDRDSDVVITLPENIEKLKELSRREGMAFDAGLTRIILPYNTTCVIKGIEGDFDLPRKEQMPEVRYLAYGSSITHGLYAARPTETYAMRTAQALGADLINLGFGGSAHCEREMADYIAGRDDWDFATLEMGINMIGDFDVEEFRSRVEYFIPKIAQAHPDKWIFCIDVFPFYCDLDTEAQKQKMFRDVVKDVVKGIKTERVKHIGGRDLLRDWAGLCTDVLHPSSLGMDEIARNLTGVISGYAQQRRKAFFNKGEAIVA